MTLTIALWLWLVPIPKVAPIGVHLPPPKNQPHVTYELAPWAC